MKEELALLQQQVKAINQAFGGFAMAVAFVLTKEQRDSVAISLSRLAENAEARGDMLLESAFIDLHNAVR